MDSSFWFETVHIERSTVYTEGSLVIISKYIVHVLHSLKIFSVLQNCVDPDETSHRAAFHLGLHCLPKYAFRRYWYTKG